MSMFNRVFKSFSGLLNLGKESSSGASTGKTITSDLVKFLIDMSNFASLDEDVIYEQLYTMESETGGGIDRISTLARQAFNGFVLEDTDHTTSDLELEMLRSAKRLARELQIPDHIEAMTELLMMFGNVFTRYSSGTFVYLPNKYVSIVSSEEDVTNLSVDKIVTVPGLLVLYENNPLYKMEKIPYSEIRHIKYKATPIFVNDVMGRTTYNIYSISPLQRALLPTWWKRQAMIIDILWRWKNLPREHHKLDSSAFTIDKYIGSKAERIRRATEDATSEIARYASSIASLNPDQGYVSLNNLDITPIESKTQHTSVNQLVDQMDKKIWSSINVPESIVNGNGASSYAAELVISNYVSTKVINIVQKFEGLILELMRDRLLQVNENYPVDLLRMDVKLTIAATQLEHFREASIMATLGMFTPDEIREMLNYPQLTDDQRKELERLMAIAVKHRESANAMKSMDGANPETPHSNAQHTRDAGQNAIMNSEK